MAAPRQMTQFTLNAKKGWPSQSAVDFEAVLDASVSDRVPQGAVVHVNASGKFALGVGSLFVMPLFTFNASDDNDVQNEGGDPATEKGVFIGINPGSSDPTDRSGRGAMLALVAIGAYELVSTNFADDTYAPNDALTSPTGTNPATAGVLEKGSYGDDTIVGVVSRGDPAQDGTIDNGYGARAIAFWPVFLPPT